MHDILLAINGTNIGSDYALFTEAIRDARPGDTMDMRIKRGDSAIILCMPVGARGQPLMRVAQVAQVASCNSAEQYRHVLREKIKRNNATSPAGQQHNQAPPATNGQTQHTRPSPHQEGDNHSSASSSSSSTSSAVAACRHDATAIFGGLTHGTGALVHTNGRDKQDHAATTAAAPQAPQASNYPLQHLSSPPPPLLEAATVSSGTSVAASDDGIHALRARGGAALHDETSSGDDDEYGAGVERVFIDLLTQGDHFRVTDVAADSSSRSSHCFVQFAPHDASAPSYGVLSWTSAGGGAATAGSFVLRSHMFVSYAMDGEASFSITGVAVAGQAHVRFEASSALIALKWSAALSYVMLPAYVRGTVDEAGLREAMSLSGSFVMEPNNGHPAHAPGDTWLRAFTLLNGHPVTMYVAEPDDTFEKKDRIVFLSIQGGGDGMGALYWYDPVKGQRAEEPSHQLLISSITDIWIGRLTRAFNESGNASHRRSGGGGGAARGDDNTCMSIIAEDGLSVWDIQCRSPRMRDLLLYALNSLLRANGRSVYMDGAEVCVEQGALPALQFTRKISYLARDQKSLVWTLIMPDDIAHEDHHTTTKVGGSNSGVGSSKFEAASAVLREGGSFRKYRAASPRAVGPGASKVTFQDGFLRLDDASGHIVFSTTKHGQGDKIFLGDVQDIYVGSTVVEDVFCVNVFSQGARPDCCFTIVSTSGARWYLEATAAKRRAEWIASFAIVAHRGGGGGPQPFFLRVGEHDYLRSSRAVLGDGGEGQLRLLGSDQVHPQQGGNRPPLSWVAAIASAGEDVSANLVPRVFKLSKHGVGTSGTRANRTVSMAPIAIVLTPQDEEDSESDSVYSGSVVRTGAADGGAAEMRVRIRSHSAIESYMRMDEAAVDDHNFSADRRLSGQSSRASLSQIAPGTPARLVSITPARLVSVKEDEPLNNDVFELASHQNRYIEGSHVRSSVEPRAENVEQPPKRARLKSLDVGAPHTVHAPDTVSAKPVLGLGFALEYEDNPASLEATTSRFWAMATSGEEPPIGEYEDGLLVARVFEELPAYVAGIRRGDFLVAVDADRIRTHEDYVASLRGVVPQQVIEVTVRRNGVLRTFPVQCGAPATVVTDDMDPSQLPRIGLALDETDHSSSSSSGGEDDEGPLPYPNRTRPRRTHSKVPVRRSAWRSTGKRLMPKRDQTLAGIDIAHVLATGAAADAGIRRGDRLVRINEHAINHRHDYLLAMAAHIGGDVVYFTLLRDGHVIRVPIVLPRCRPPQRGELGIMLGSHANLDEGFLIVTVRDQANNYLFPAKESCSLRRVSSVPTSTKAAREQTRCSRPSTLRLLDDPLL